MAKDIFWTLLTFGIIIGILILSFWPANKSSVVVVQYDCRVLIGGWHPDVPLKVQEECRKRSNK
jgi:uncharacterized integral membrane protein